MKIKEFRIRPDCSESELGTLTSDGWQIQYMQFMPDGKLNVVFVREVADEPAAPAAPVVIVEPVAVPVASKPLPMGTVIMGLDEPRSVPLTHNKFKTGDTRKVHVPDGVMGEALRRGKETYDAAMAQGAEQMRRAGEAFRPNFRTETSQ